MRVNGLTSQILAYRRTVRDWKREGYEEVSEDGAPLWELHRGPRQGHIIKDVRIAPGAQGLFVLIGTRQGNGVGMKMREAMAIMESVPEGFMVGAMRIDGCMLVSAHFPDKHSYEPLIPTENEAWDLAARFATATRGKYVDIYVVDHEFRPVDGYRDRMMNKAIELKNHITV